MTVTNSYVTRQDFLNWIYAVTQVLATDDLVIDEILEQASRYCDDTTGRRFYPLQATRQYDIPYDGVLQLVDDLLSLTTLTNGDLTVISSSDYVLQSVNAPPYWAIRLRDTSSVDWQPSAAGSAENVITVNGVWGYHPDYTTRGWSLAGTLGAAISDTTTLAFTMTAGHSLVVGNIAKVDSELFNVGTAGATACAMNARGDNGSTAATHLNGASVYVWNAYKPIRSAVLQIAQSIYKRRHGESLSGIASVTAAGVVITPQDVPQLAQRILMELSRFS
jgi:hypothetical protein